MNKIILIIFLSISILYANNETIEIKPLNIINNQTINLTDLVKEKKADINLPDISFGNAPLPGQERILDKNYIIFRLKTVLSDEELNKIIIPEKIRVQRSFKKLDKDEIITKIKNEITKLIGDKYKIENVNLRNADEIKLPDINEIKYEIEFLSKSEMKNRVNGLINIIAENQKIKSINFDVNISAWTKVIVAKENFNFNDVITNDKIEEVLMEVTKIKTANLIKKKEEIINKAAKRRIRKGEIIEVADIKEPDIIKYGDIVDVIVQKKDFQIRVKAKALQNGATGDVIRFLNLNSKKTFFAEITNVSEAIIR